MPKLIHQTNEESLRPTRGNPALEVPPLMFAPHEHTGWVYIMASKPDGILYVGQTTNLPQRAYQHREGLVEGFTKKYGCKTLVYFEGYQLITESIAREDAMKTWRREWKIRRILATNPEWRDLYADICQ